MPKIRLENVSKYYRQDGRVHAILREVNLTIAQGEFVFLVGSSGAGKSTLMQIMSGQLKSDSGAVYLDRLNLARVPPWYWPKLRRTFGQMHQESTLMRKRTVEENLSIIMKATRNPLQRTHQKLRVMKALGIVGMSNTLHKYPGELSVGESRRVELARAILNNPPILMLDELTANLDEDTGWDLMHLLLEINRQGTTIIMSTHSSNFVNLMRKRVVTLVDGRIAGDVLRGKYGQIMPKQHFIE